MTEGGASAAHRAEYLALRGLIGALGALEPGRAAALGARAARLGYWPLRVRRDVVVTQIGSAFPDWRPADVDRVARLAYEHLGRVTAETALLPRLGRQGVLRLFEGVDGWQVIADAMHGGRGLIITTGHLGNWEAAGAFLAARGVPVDVVVRRMSNPLFDRYLNGTRAALGMRVVRDQDAVRQTARSVRAGRAVAFLTDQGVKHLASTFVPFFGRPAKTPRGPAVFALRWNVPMIFGAALRQPGGRYRLHLEHVAMTETGDRERDVDAAVGRYTEALERYVRMAPEQYFWHHRRWRRQPPGTPDPLEDPTAEDEE